MWTDEDAAAYLAFLSACCDWVMGNYEVQGGKGSAVTLLLKRHANEVADVVDEARRLVRGRSWATSSSPFDASVMNTAQPPPADPLRDEHERSMAALTLRALDAAASLVAWRKVRDLGAVVDQEASARSIIEGRRAGSGKVRHALDRRHATETIRQTFPGLNFVGYMAAERRKPEWGLINVERANGFHVRRSLTDFGENTRNWWARNFCAAADAAIDLLHDEVVRTARVRTNADGSPRVRPPPVAPVPAAWAGRYSTAEKPFSPTTTAMFVGPARPVSAGMQIAKALESLPGGFAGMGPGGAGDPGANLQDFRMNKGAGLRATERAEPCAPPMHVSEQGDDGGAAPRRKDWSSWCFDDGEDLDDKLRDEVGNPAHRFYGSDPASLINAAVWGRNADEFDEALRFEHDAHRGISSAQFERVYNARCFANRQGFIFNVEVTIAWKKCGVTDQDEVDASIKQLLERYRHWVADQDAPCLYIAVVEYHPDKGLHTHLALHLPWEARAKFRKWLRATLPTLRHAGEVEKGVENTDVRSEFNVWRQDRWLKYMLKGIDPVEKLALGRGVKRREWRLAEIVDFHTASQGMFCINRVRISEALLHTFQKAAGFKPLMRALSPGADLWTEAEHNRGEAEGACTPAPRQAGSPTPEPPNPDDLLRL
jgi:hypothetical protein